MTRIALTAALILATVSGCATTLPGGTQLKLTAKPAARAAAKAFGKAVAPGVKAQAAPVVSILKGADAAAVKADDQVAATVDADADTTLDAFEAFADEDGGATLQGGYQLQGVLGLGVGLKAKLRAKMVAWGVLRADVKSKVLTRRAVRARVVKAKLAHREDVRKAFKAVPWVDNGDGTKTKSVDYSVNVTVGEKAYARHIAGTITINAETKALILATGELSQAMPNGATHEATSEKALQPDGGYLVTRHSLTTLKGGRTRTADATRTIDVEGAIQGTGTVTWKDAAGATISTKTWSFAGNEDTDAPEAIEEEPVSGEETEAVDAAPAIDAPAADAEEAL